MEEIEINFNKWVMGNSSMYVITTSWNSIVKNNHLRLITLCNYGHSESIQLYALHFRNS
ncbi:hypothetical protein Gotur_001368, partial [Gossypium turneri]